QVVEALGLSLAERKEADPTDPTGSTQFTYLDSMGEVPSFDGLTLRLRVRLPETAAGPLPTVMYRHGWDTNPSNPAWVDFDAPWFAKQEFAFVSFPARGRNDSGGYEPKNPFPLLDALDGLDATA